MLNKSTDTPPAHVLITPNLRTRNQRAADFDRESHVMKHLATELARAPETILQTLVESCLDIFSAGSAGISIDETENGQDVFKWHAVAGKFEKFLHATLPRHFSPCGVVLERNSVQLMSDPERHYPYIKDLGLPIHEVLLVPFFKDEKPVGTIWVVSHDGSKSFDAEDSRLLHSLAQFVSSAVDIYKRLTKTN
jgi:hypothetical protein